MFKLPDIFSIKKTAANAFEREIQTKYEELMQYFSAEVTKAANNGYCGWSERFMNRDAVLHAALERCKKEIRKQGYRCHMEMVYNCRTDKPYDAIDFTISWRANWFNGTNARSQRNE